MAAQQKKTSMWSQQCDFRKKHMWGYSIEKKPQINLTKERLTLWTSLGSSSSRPAVLASQNELRLASEGSTDITPQCIQVKGITLNFLHTEKTRDAWNWKYNTIYSNPDVFNSTFFSYNWILLATNLLVQVSNFVLRDLNYYCDYYYHNYCLLHISIIKTCSASLFSHQTRLHIG